MRKIAIFAFILLFACRLDAQIMKLRQQIGGVTYPVVIDNSAMSTKTKKTGEELKQQRVSDANWAMKPHLEYEEINRKVSPRYAVSPKEMGEHTWLDAQKVCAEYTGPSNVASEAGKWRLPTQREMIWLFILGAMDNLNMSNFTSLKAEKFYWCATEYSDKPANAWYLHNTWGSSTSGFAKTSRAFARCIRDL